MKRLTGKIRLAILISVIWFVVCLTIGWENREPVAGVFYGGFPLLVAWGIWWVKRGFKKDKDE